MLPANREGEFISLFTNITTAGCHRDEMKDEGASDSDILNNSAGQSSTASTMQQQHQQYLGDVDVVLQNFPDIDWGSTLIPGNISVCSVCLI